MIRKIVIVGDGESAIRCHNFFRKYGFEVAFFVGEDRESILDVKVLKPREIVASPNAYIVFASESYTLQSVAKERFRKLGVAPRDLIQHEILYSPWMGRVIDSLSFNRKTIPNEYLMWLLDNPESGEEGPKSVVKTLATYVASKIKKDMKSGEKIVGVYYPSTVYRGNLGSGEMYDRIRQQGYNVIFLFDVICNDEYERRPYSYYSGRGIIKYLDFIDIFIFPMFTDNLPERAKKVYFPHDIYDSPPGPIKVDECGRLLDPPLLDELDYVFQPSKVVMEEGEVPYKRKKPKCNIPGGYPKLDYNIRYFQSCNLPTDSLIYATTVTSDHYESYVSLPEHGAEIVGALLHNFPDYKIIFRPHPHTLQTDYVANIVREFSNYSRFIFDTSPSSYMDNYCRANLMITDMSGTAFTYAFTTLRPVVFFSHKEGEVEEAFNRVKYFRDREEIGYIATNTRELIEKIKLALKNKDKFKRKIRKFRDSVMFNVGRSEDYFVENFHYIAEDKKHPDWHYIPV